jgi:hypothetical protein
MRPTVLAFVLLIVSNLLADSTAIVEQPVPADKPTVADAFLSQKLSIWQKRLRLQDWKVTVKLVRKSELKPKTLGNVHWDLSSKTAVIRVMHFEDYAQPFGDVLEDFEMTVVHELVHLHLASLPRSDSTKGAEEQAVNMLAEALVSLDRNKQ